MSNSTSLKVIAKINRTLSMCPHSSKSIGLLTPLIHSNTCEVDSTIVPSFQVRKLHTRSLHKLLEGSKAWYKPERSGTRINRFNHNALGIQERSYLQPGQPQPSSKAHKHHWLLLPFRWVQSVARLIFSRYISLHFNPLLKTFQWSPLLLV